MEGCERRVDDRLPSWDRPSTSRTPRVSSTRPASIPSARRASQAIEAGLERRGWLGYERREAPAAPLDARDRRAPEAYVEAVRSRSAGRGSLDEETVLSPGSYGAALHAAGGACAMADALMAGEARAAFCATRPPGHHARSDDDVGLLPVQQRRGSGAARARRARRPPGLHLRLGRPSRRRHQRHLPRERRRPLRQHPPVRALSRHGAAA